MQAPYKKHLNLLPNYMQDGVVRYIDHGIDGGDFLNAVLENNFVHALGRADMINHRMLNEWAEFLYIYAPSSCWGSVEKVAEWKRRGGLVGIEEWKEKIKADAES